MKTMKKVLCMVMALAMVVALGAMSASASAADTIKIGWLGPLTGGVAQYGEAVKSGVDLYIRRRGRRGEGHRRLQLPDGRGRRRHRRLRDYRSHHRGRQRGLL